MKLFWFKFTNTDAYIGKRELCHRVAWIDDHWVLKHITYFKEYTKYEAKHAFSEISSNLKRIEISFQLQRHCILFVPSSLTCFLLMLPAPTTAARQSSPEVTAACHHLSFPSPLFPLCPFFNPLFSNLDPYRLDQQWPTDLAAACKPLSQLASNLPKPAAANS